MPEPTLTTYNKNSVGYQSKYINRDTIASEQQLKAMTDRADAEKASANAINFPTLTKKEQRAAKQISNNEPPTPKNQPPTTAGTILDTRQLPRYVSPPKPKKTSKCEGSSCTMSGGKRRKTRKHRGSRKSKKSKRR